MKCSLWVVWQSWQLVLLEHGDGRAQLKLAVRPFPHRGPGGGYQAEAIDPHLAQPATHRVRIRCLLSCWCSRHCASLIILLSCLHRVRLVTFCCSHIGTLSHRTFYSSALCRNKPVEMAWSHRPSIGCAGTFRRR